MKPLFVILALIFLAVNYFAWKQGCYYCWPGNAYPNGG